MLVIGYGSLIRGDDGVGQVLADALRSALSVTDVMTCTQLTIELAEPLSRAERACFIDACVDGTPGSIHRQPLHPKASADSFTHNLTPETLLGTAVDLYGSAPESFLITVTGASFDYGIDLSPQLRAQLPTLIETAQRWLDEAAITPN